LEYFSGPKGEAFFGHFHVKPLLEPSAGLSLAWTALRPALNCSALTMDTYSHVLPTMQRDAMSLLDRAFKEYDDSGAVKQSENDLLQD